MESIYNRLVSFYYMVSNFFDSVVNVFVYIWSVIQSVYYGITTLLSGTYDLIVQLFTSGIF